jgi:hypothetical protein
MWSLRMTRSGIILQTPTVTQRVTLLRAPPPCGTDRDMLTLMETEYVTIGTQIPHVTNPVAETLSMVPISVELQVPEVRTTR